MNTPIDRTIRITSTVALAISLAACGSTASMGTRAPSPVAPSAATSSALSAPTASPAPSPSTAVVDDTTVGEGQAWIAFQDHNVSLHLIRPDGTGDHAVFPLIPGGMQLHPDWSPDGAHLSLTLRGDTDVIWVGDADGSNTRKVTDCVDPCKLTDEAAWSPDGTSLIYHRMVSKPDGVGVSTLELLDLATDKTRVVLTAPAGRAFYQPRWSPDGTRVVTEFVTMASPAFDSDVIGVALAIVDVASAKPTVTELTDATTLTNSPDWSWVTDRLVFARPSTARGFDGPNDIVTMNPDGTAQTIVTSVGSRGGQTPQPAWILDGTRIVFVDPGSHMLTIALDGSDQQPAVAGDPIYGLHPRYRPTP